MCHPSTQILGWRKTKYSQNPLTLPRTKIETMGAVPSSVPLHPIPRNYIQSSHHIHHDMKSNEQVRPFWETSSNLPLHPPCYYIQPVVTSILPSYVHRATTSKPASPHPTYNSLHNMKGQRKYLLKKSATKIRSSGF